jgi:regulator of sirC expression with transglutaminase-like and TPR domain
MVSPLHFEVPTALQYFAALVADDDGFSTLEAAVAVAQDEDAGLDVQGVLSQIDELAQQLKRRVPADAAPMQRLRLLNHYFFGELGFAGNVNNYYDAGNSHLPTVLATRRGIPITLALLYIELATQVGLRAAGVSFPGHFLVKLQLPVGEVVLDPFCGQSLSREELDERLRPYLQQSGLMKALRQQLPGDFEAPLTLFLQTASPRPCPGACRTGADRGGGRRPGHLPGSLPRGRRCPAPARATGPVGRRQPPGPGRRPVAALKPLPSR